jgi:hypothetical protein
VTDGRPDGADSLKMIRTPTNRATFARVENLRRGVDSARRKAVLEPVAF